MTMIQETCYCRNPQLNTGGFWLEQSFAAHMPMMTATVLEFYSTVLLTLSHSLFLLDYRNIHIK